MTKDDIIALPNPHLRQKSSKVGIITPEIEKIVQDMKDATINWDESRDHEVGVALAAIQIDRAYRIIVVRNNYDDKEDHVFTTFINPTIVKKEGEQVEDYEGCLSVPFIYGKVSRYSKVKVKARNLKGDEFRVTAEGFLARIFQHEIDHCHGILFIDHIKGNEKAFYKLAEDGKLDPLNYEKHIRNSSILW
jgi:peptide deformylase